MKKKYLPFVILGILIVGGLAIGGFIPLTSYLGGMTITSVSSSQVISQNTDLSGVWILINAITQGADSIVGTLTPEQTKQFSGGAWENQYPLEIKLNSVDEKYQARIVNDKTPIYKYYVADTSCGNIFVPSCSQTDPQGGILQTYIRSTEGCGWWGEKHKCMYKSQLGVKGSLVGEKVSYSAQVSLTAQGKTLSQIITSENPSAEFREGTNLLATLTAPASLITGDQPPDLTRYVATTYLGNVNWKIANKDKFYVNYLNAYNLVEGKIKPYYNTAWFFSDVAGFNDLVQKTNNLNSISDSLLSSDVNIGSGQTKENPTSLNNAKLSFSLDRRITAQNLVFKVRADWIGIKVAVGKPQIISLSCPEFRSGGEGVLSVIVKNVGSDGVFVASMSGCEPFVQSYTAGTNTKSIKSGQTETFELKFTGGSSNEKITKTCNVKISDYTLTSIYDQRSVSCSMSPAVMCEPNKQVVDGNCIYVCSADGYTRKLIKCCELGLNYDVATKTYNCKEKEGCIKEGESYGGVLGLGEKECCSGLIKNKETGTCEKPEIIDDISKYLVFLILTPLGALLGYAIGKKKDKVVYAGIGAIGGLIVAFIVDWAFKNWLALLFVGVFGTAIYWLLGAGGLITIAIVITMLRKKR